MTVKRIPKVLGLLSAVTISSIAACAHTTEDLVCPRSGADLEVLGGVKITSYEIRGMCSVDCSNPEDGGGLPACAEYHVTATEPVTCELLLHFANAPDYKVDMHLIKTSTTCGDTISGERKYLPDGVGLPLDAATDATDSPTGDAAPSARD